MKVTFPLCNDSVVWSFQLHPKENMFLLIGKINYGKCFLVELFESVRQLFWRTVRVRDFIGGTCTFIM